MLTGPLSANQIDRRKFLKGSAFTSIALLLSPSIQATSKITSEKTLGFYNLHTNEKIQCCYWSGNGFDQHNLEKINYILRDHRTGDIQAIDPDLLNLLHNLHQTAGSNMPYHVISAFRSAKTNAKLRKNSSGVAKKSLHMQGKAIDVRLPDIELKALRDVAISFNAGGVGYYAKSGFLHIDVGRPRTW